MKLFFRLFITVLSIFLGGAIEIDNHCSSLRHQRHSSLFHLPVSNTVQVIAAFVCLVSLAWLIKLVISLLKETSILRANYNWTTGIVSPETANY